MVVTLLFRFVSQVTVPFAAIDRTACPGGQVPVTRSCLLLTEVAVALKFVFTSAAVAGVPGTNVLGMVKSAGQASGVNTSALKAKQFPAVPNATLRIVSMGSSKFQLKEFPFSGP